MSQSPGPDVVVDVVVVDVGADVVVVVVVVPFGGGGLITGDVVVVVVGVGGCGGTFLYTLYKHWEIRFPRAFQI